MYVNAMLDFIAKGGYQFMITLLLLSIIALGVILERVYCLWLCCSISKDHFTIIRKHLEKNEFEEALKIVTGKPTLPYSIITSALTLVINNPGKISFIQSLQKCADRQIVWLCKRFWLLKAVAYIAPMLGLLGTVVGLQISFGTVGQAGLDQKSVAAGIAMALITTITGLVIALPTLFAESSLRAWARSRYEEINTMLDDLTLGL
jgi:biopolymer transport protein ExbB